MGVGSCPWPRRRERFGPAEPVTSPASSTTGTVKVNCAPWPGPPLVAQMRPPWASTSPFEITSPSPDPPSPAPVLIACRDGVLLKKVRQLLRRHALALVGDRDRHLHAIARSGHPDGR